MGEREVIVGGGPVRRFNFGCRLRARGIRGLSDTEGLILRQHYRPGNYNETYKPQLFFHEKSQDLIPHQLDAISAPSVFSILPLLGIAAGGKCEHKIKPEVQGLVETGACPVSPFDNGAETRQAASLQSII